MLVVAGRPDEVEANAVAPPMRRAFEAGLKKAGECPGVTCAHKTTNARGEESSRIDRTNGSVSRS
jgi:hypothetical protein